MPPGLAGFIASGDEQRTHGDVIAAVLTALSGDYTVVPERTGAPGGARRQTMLDTFDWRLNQAGLALEYAASGRSGELRLSAVSGTAGSGAGPVAVQPVSGWQTARPHRLEDMPDGPVTARIAGRLALRALLPLVTVVTPADGYRLLNADGKTVARLVVERPSIPGRNSVELAPRLSVAEVRGYPGHARRATRIVAASPGVGPAAETVLAAALRALGRRPGDYSNKVDAAITAALPAVVAAAVILLRLLDTVEANVPGVLADTDTEFLHDLRVSVRRTRSALKLFGDVLTAPRSGSGKDGAPAAGAAGLTGEELAFFAAEFKWVGDLTTPTRDLDVHLLDYPRTAASLTAAKPDDLEPFRVYLEQRRRKEYRALVRGLRSPRFTTLTQEWRSKLNDIKQNGANGSSSDVVRPGRSLRVAGGSAGLLAAERTRTAFAKVAKRGAAITADSPAEALHDLRKRCKELRYALEFFAPLRDRAGSVKVVGDLKRLQDCLGEFQDTEVQIAEIRALATAMLAAGEAPAVTLLAMGEVTAGIAVRQRAARSDFARRFDAFADVEGRRRMSALLRGTGDRCHKC